MNLIIKRFKHTEESTLGILTDKDYPKLFRFLVVEPPISGLSKTPLSTLEPGTYKLFAKTNLHQNKINIRTQKVSNKPYFVFTPVEKEVDVRNPVFVSRVLSKFEVLFLIGSYKGTHVCPDEDSYQKFITRIFIALKNKEKIYLNIE